MCITAIITAIFIFRLFVKLSPFYEIDQIGSIPNG